MKKRFTLAVAFLLAAGAAFAQEGATGAGRVELGVFPGGALFFGKAIDENAPNFGNYALGAAFSVNVNRWIGLEAELGGGIGLRQDMSFKTAILTHQKTPNMIGYTGNVIVHVIGSDRAIAPYASAASAG